MEPMSRVSSPTFVGRESELKQIGKVLQDAFRGRSALVLLAGEAGVGKTRLVEEVARQARDLGGIALVGACVVGGSALPFAPLAEALRTLAIDRSPNRAGKLPGPTEIELMGLLPDSGHPGAPSWMSNVDETAPARSGAQRIRARALLGHDVT